MTMNTASSTILNSKVPVVLVHGSTVITVNNGNISVTIGDNSHPTENETSHAARQFILALAPLFRDETTRNALSQIGNYTRAVSGA